MGNSRLGTLRSVYMPFWRLCWKLRSFRSGGLQPGDLFADFALSDLNGVTHRLSDRSEARFSFLWFTNLCEDCRNRIALLNELHREAGQRVRIFAVSILDKNDPLPRQVAPECSFPVLIDPEDVVGSKLGLTHPPDACPLHNLFVVSSTGRIVFRHHLSAIKPEEFRKLWQKLLQGEVTVVRGVAARN